MEDMSLSIEAGWRWVDRTRRRIGKRDRPGKKERDEGD